MSDELTADQIRSLLEVEPNATCGFVRVTFVSNGRSQRVGCRHRSRSGDLWVPRSTFW
jgi:hypothetical protein